MPLRIQCPNGCVMRVPSNRAGMSARCPGCKEVVVIPFPPSDYQSSDVLDAVRASSAVASSKSDAPKVVESSEDAIDRKLEAKESGDKQPAVEKATEKNAVEKPAEDKPVVEESVVEKPAVEKPAVEKPAVEKPAVEKPAVEKPAVEKPEVKKTSVDNPESKKVPSKKLVKETTADSQISGTSEKPRTKKKKRKPKNKKTAAPTQQKPSVAANLADAKEESSKVKPVATRAKVTPPEPTASAKRKPKEPLKVREPSPLDAAFSSFDPAKSTKPSEQPAKPQQEEKPQPVDTPRLKVNGERSVTEALSSIPVPNFGAKQVAELPTVEPVNRVEEQISISEPKNSAIDPKAFRFENTSPETASFATEDSAPEKMSAIELRTRRANADRVTLTRFFAAMLVFVGLVNFAPAIYCWYTWSQVDIDFLLPRWIYLQIFIAVLHLVYAVLLLQVPDWSTLRSIAVVMLAFAFVFGLFSMGLLTTGGNGLLAQFLQVPDSLGRQACIWCVAMLCLATLASYLAGRESNNWQRTERLLAEILANKEAV